MHAPACPCRQGPTSFCVQLYCCAASAFANSSSTVPSRLIFIPLAICSQVGLISFSDMAHLPCSKGRCKDLKKKLFGQRRERRRCGGLASWSATILVASKSRLPSGNNGGAQRAVLCRSCSRRTR